MDGQYSDPGRVVGLNNAEGWSRDVSRELADEIEERCAMDGFDSPPSLERFVDRHGRKARAAAVAAARKKPYGDFILSGAANLNAGAYLRNMKIERKVRLIPHEAVLDTGSFEVAYPDGRPSDFFYFEDNPGRRLRPDVMTRPEAQRAAQAKARQEQDALDGN